MNAVLQTSLAPAQKRGVLTAKPLPMLAEGGAAVTLGTCGWGDGAAVPLVPAADSLFGPRGVCVARDGSLWVCDTGHHRLLGWPVVPDMDGDAAQILVGQPSFADEGRNARGEAGAATLNMPTGITACGDGLAVADAWNHRVLIWHETPRRHDQPADLVLGQRDFHSVAGNRGDDQPCAGSLFWPFGVAWDGERLWVADTGNRRVLMWHGYPRRHGQRADLVLGQADFACRDENAGGTPDARSMRWPHSIARCGERLFVADAGNNRVMVWEHGPEAAGQPCDAMLGQHRADAVDHNQGDYWPTAAALNMPYGIAVAGTHLLVADTANSRLLAWRGQDIVGLGAMPRWLAAQPDWEAKGDNRWLPAARDSLCWPFALCKHDQMAVIADAGNNRVLLWRLSPEFLA